MSKSKFDRGQPQNTKRTLQVRPSAYEMGRLQEIADETAKAEKISLTRTQLVRSAVKAYVEKYPDGKAPRPDEFPSADDPRPMKDQKFSRGNSPRGDPFPVPIPPDHFDVVDKIATFWKADWSDVVRVAYRELIDYYDKHGHI